MTERSLEAPGRKRPPVILMGGAGGNALSVARSLGRHGVDVYLLPDSPNVYSRYARYIDLPKSAHYQQEWTRYLLGPASERLRGAVLLSCCDAGIETLLGHRERLSQKFILDISNPDAQRCLLSKLTTYEKANEAGIPTPRFWKARSVEEVRTHEDEYVFPLLVKPLYSHRFHAVFGDKFFRVTDFGGLVAAYERVRAHDLDVVLLEEIPGPDDLLCSYFTYLDETGEPQCDFTKRVIRRYPENRGPGCYHITDWNPEVRDLGRRMFRDVGLLGVGNIEFKRDQRDGCLKIIECNARFTAVNALLIESGWDLALFVYNRLAGIHQPPLKGKRYKEGLHFWDPSRDVRAFIALNADGRLGLREWLLGLAHRQVLPYFRWYDPVPAIVGTARLMQRASELGVRRLVKTRPSSPERRSPGGGKP